MMVLIEDYLLNDCALTALPVLCQGLEQLLRGRTLPTPFILDEKRTKELQAQ